MNHESGSADSQKPIPKAEGCPHYFGYLAQRPKSEVTPDECMTCKKLVECMLSTSESASVSESHVTMQETKRNISAKPEANAKTEKNKFKVENLDMLFRAWSGTVRIGELVLSNWGGKIDEVEIQTANGKKAQCRVYPIKESKKDIVQVPDKIQLFLGIIEGELVTVKPIKKK